jgi:hypothetical protein
MATLLCAKMSFGETQGTLQRFWGWAPATKSLLKMVDQVGPLARPFLEGQAAPDDDGEVLYILVDSKGAPMITETEHSRRCKPHVKRPRGEPRRNWRRRRKKPLMRQRRKKGDKSKNAKMANVGVIYTLRVTSDGFVEGPIHKRVYGTFRTMKELMVWLLAEARKRGYGTKRTIFLADGDRKIWRLQAKYFPLATPCLDLYHVAEKLWEMGAALYAEGSDELAVWVAEQLADLKAGHAGRVVRRLQKLNATLSRSGPGTKGKRKRMAQGIGYLKKNLERMPYAELRRDGLDVGSGAVEGAVRQIGIRLDGPGMRWTPARAEYVLQLRCIVVSDLWDSFAEHVQQHAHREGLRALPPEGLGSTHNARERKAA